MEESIFYYIIRVKEDKILGPYSNYQEAESIREKLFPEGKIRTISKSNLERLVKLNEEKP